MPTKSAPDLCADRKEPLLSHFKSVYACLAPGPEPAVGDLEKWLLAFRRWYEGEMSAAVARGVSPNHFFGPNVTIMGPASVRYAAEFAPSFRRLCDVGLSPQVSLDLIDAIGDPRALTNLAKGGLAQVDLHMGEASATGPIPDATGVASDLLARGVRLRLFGTVDEWLATGLLDLEATNSGFLSIFPLPERTIVTRNARPCGPRFGLWIDPRGHIFPCAGLMGVDDFRLGSIRTVLEGSSEVPLDPSVLVALQDLARSGPDLPGDTSAHLERIGQAKVFPLICRQHRAALGAGSIPPLAFRR